MIVPAQRYKSVIEKKMQQLYYTDEMYYYQGCLYNSLPQIKDDTADNVHYAVVDTKGEVTGYFSYFIDWYGSQFLHFGIVSFTKDRLNVELVAGFGTHLQSQIEQVKPHRIEWRMVGGNPIEKSYDRLLEQISRTGYSCGKLELKDATRDKTGKYRNMYIYECIKED